MDKTRQFFASVSLAAPPMLYRDPSDQAWSRFVRHNGSDTDGLIYALESLAPTTYATTDLKILANAIEYLGIVAQLQETHDSEEIFSSSNPSPWRFVYNDPEENIGIVHLSSLEEEFYAAAYNAAAASLQVASIYSTKQGLENYITNALRLTLFAQRILCCLHMVRETNDPLTSGVVTLAAMNEALQRIGPLHTNANALDALATCVHAQLAELQIALGLEESSQSASSKFYYVAETYDACRELLETDRIPKLIRLSVVPDKLRRLVAVKRHLGKAIAVSHHLVAVESMKWVQTTALLGRRYADECKKSLKKTRPLIDTNVALLQRLRTDPLAGTRQMLESKLTEICIDLEAIRIDEQSMQSESDVDTVIEQITATSDGIKYKLTEHSDWSLRNLSTKVLEFYLKIRGLVLPNLPTIITEAGMSDLLVMFGQPLPEAVSEQQPDDPKPPVAIRPIDRFCRLFRMHKEVVKRLSQHQDSTPHPDRAIYLKACRQALLHVSAITHAIFIEDIQLETEHVLYVGQLETEGRHEEARRAWENLPLRPLEVIQPLLPMLDECQDQLRRLLKDQVG